MNGTLYKFLGDLYNKTNYSHHHESLSVNDKTMTWKFILHDMLPWNMCKMMEQSLPQALPLQLHGFQNTCKCRPKSFMYFMFPNIHKCM